MKEFGKQGEVKNWIRADDSGKDLMFYTSILANKNRKQSKLGSVCVFVEVCQ